LKLPLSLVSSSLILVRSNNANANAQEGSSLRRAKEDHSFCDGLKGPLYGLCAAYCDKKRCHEVVTTEGDSKESDTSCAEILENFVDKAKAKANDEDLTMPCLEPPVVCPCWTQKELDRFPLPTGHYFCNKDSNYCGSTGKEDYGSYNWDGNRDTTDCGPNTAEVMECGTGASSDRRPRCVFHYRDPETCNFIVFNHHDGITREEFAVCEQQVNALMSDLGLVCSPSDSCKTGYTCPTE
jgi:hypothetical protein